jgi:hypothetical protein
MSTVPSCTPDLRYGVGILVPVLVWALAAPSWVPWCRLLGGILVVLIVVLLVPRVRLAE